MAFREVTMLEVKRSWREARPARDDEGWTASTRCRCRRSSYRTWSTRSPRPDPSTCPRAPTAACGRRTPTGTADAGRVQARRPRGGLRPLVPSLQAEGKALHLAAPRRRKAEVPAVRHATLGDGDPAPDALPRHAPHLRDASRAGRLRRRSATARDAPPRFQDDGAVRPHERGGPAGRGDLPSARGPRAGRPARG
jgi:hypothetical protein